MYELEKLTLQIQDELNNIETPTPEYTESGELIKDSLTANFWKLTVNKEKLQFMLKRLEEFKQSEIDSLEKVRGDDLD